MEGQANRFQKRYVIDTISTGEFQWLSANSALFRQLLEDGARTLGLFPFLLQDIFYGLWLETPRLLPFDRTSTGARLNRLVIEQLMKSGEFKKARAYTKGNLPVAAMAAMYFAELLLLGLNETLKETADEILWREEDLFTARRHSAVAERMAELAEAGSRDDLVGPYREQSREWADRAAEQQKMLRTLGARLNMLWNTSGQQKTAFAGGSESGQKQGRFESGAEGQGTRKGVWTKGDLTRSLQRADLYLQSPKLKKLADRLGRLKEAGRHRRTREHAENALEISGIEYGNDLSEVVPEEWADYFEPARKAGFLKKYADEALCLYDYHGQGQKGRGSLVICVDNSGSMQGPKEDTAKAIALALMEIAFGQKRNMVIIMFGGPEDEPRVFEFPGGQGTVEQLGEVAEFFLCSAGTDFEVPLRRAVGFLERDQYARGDIVFITDGVCRTGPVFLAWYRARKKAKQFRTVGVLVNYGRVPTAPVEAFCDELLFSKDLKGHDIVGELTGLIEKG